MLELYRDSVHYDIELDELAIRIINSKEFQWLHGRKQLGFADYAFRGATHTRFSHSVGVYHLALKILDEVRKNHRRWAVKFPVHLMNGQLSGVSGLTEDEATDPTVIPDILLENLKILIGAVALLHDITHIPSGHALEDEFREVYRKHDAVTSLRLYYLLFDERSNIYRAFEESQPFIKGIDNNKLKRLIYVILKYRIKIGNEDDPYKIKDFEEILTEELERLRNSKEKDDERELRVQSVQQQLNDYKEFTNEGLFHPFMADIVSNTICADLLDYLERDGLYCGLEIRVNKRIYAYFVITPDSITKKPHLVLRVIDHKGILRTDAEDGIIKTMHYRHELASTVYYHREKVAADIMLSSALSKMGYPPDNNPEKKSDSILLMSDCDILNPDKVSQKEGRNLQAVEILKMISERRLYKLCLQIPNQYAIQHGIKDLLTNRFRDDRNFKINVDKLERKLCQLTGNNELSVLVFCPPSRPQAKEIDTWVQIEENIVLPLKRVYTNLNITSEIDLLKKKYDDLWSFFIFISPQHEEEELILVAIVKALVESMNEELDVKHDYSQLLKYCRCHKTILNILQEYFTEWRKNRNIYDSRIIEAISNSLVQEFDTDLLLAKFDTLDKKSIIQSFERMFLRICAEENIDFAKDLKLSDNDKKEIIQLLEEDFSSLEVLHTNLKDHTKSSSYRGKSDPAHVDFFQPKIKDAFRRIQERRKNSTNTPVGAFG